MKDSLKYLFYILLVGLAISLFYGTKYVINQVYTANNLTDKLEQLDKRVDDKLQVISSQNVTKALNDLDVKGAQTVASAQETLAKLDKVLENAKNIPSPPKLPPAPPKDKQPEVVVPETPRDTDTRATRDTLEGMWSFYCEAGRDRGVDESNCPPRRTGQGKVQAEPTAKRR